MAVDKALRGRDYHREAEERKAQIDALIDAYETPGVRAGPKVIDVNCFPGEIKFASKDANGVLHYRGRILRCIKKRSASAERHLKEAHADIEVELQRQREESQRGLL